MSRQARHDVIGMLVRSTRENDRLIFLIYKSPRHRGFFVCLFCFSELHADASAQNLRVGIGGLSQKALVVGSDGKERRIHARKLPRVFENLVSAEVDDDVHLLIEVIGYLFFDCGNIVFLLYHRQMIDKAKEIYTLFSNRTARADNRRLLRKI